jgi:hypothetical protein
MALFFHGKLPMILDVLVPVGFCVIFCVKPVNALFTGSEIQRTISTTRNLRFCGFFTAATTWFPHFCSRLVFTAALQVLPSTF